MGPSGTRHSRVFAFAQDGSLGIQGNFGQFRLFIFFLVVLLHQALSRKRLLSRIIPSKPCFFNALASQQLLFNYGKNSGIKGFRDSGIKGFSSL